MLDLVCDLEAAGLPFPRARVLARLLDARGVGRLRELQMAAAADFCVPEFDEQVTADLRHALSVSNRRPKPPAAPRRVHCNAPAVRRSRSSARRAARSRSSSDSNSDSGASSSSSSSADSTARQHPTVELALRLLRTDVIEPPRHCGPSQGGRQYDFRQRQGEGPMARAAEDTGNPHPLLALARVRAERAARIQRFCKAVRPDDQPVLQPLQADILAWSAMFRHVGTLKNYLGLVKTGCLLVGVSTDVFSSPATRRAKQAVAARGEFSSRKKLFLGKGIVEKLVALGNANERFFSASRLFWFAYCFLLRVPSEALPVIACDSSADNCEAQCRITLSEGSSCSICGAARTPLADPCCAASAGALGKRSCAQCMA